MPRLLFRPVAMTSEVLACVFNHKDSYGVGNIVRFLTSIEDNYCLGYANGHMLNNLRPALKTGEGRNCGKTSQIVLAFTLRRVASILRRINS